MLQGALAGYALVLAVLFTLAIPSFRETRAIPVPDVPPLRWLPFESVDLVSLYFTAAFGLLLGWGIWVGFGALFRMFVGHAFHRVALHLCVLVPSTAGVVLGTVSFLVKFAAQFSSLVAGRWFMGRSRITKVRRVPRLRAIGRLSRRHAELQAEIRVDRAMDVVIPWVRSMVSRWALGGRVSMAPLEASTWAEASRSSRLPAQTFAAAASQLRDDLASVGDDAAALELAVLPSIWRPRTPESARLLRRATGSDLLLWGGFLDDDNTGWFQVERKVPSAATELGDRLRLVRVHTQDGGELFPEHWSVRLTPSLRVDLRDERDTHTVFLLSALQVFEDRSCRRRRLLPRHADRFFELFTGHREALARLLLESFEQIPEEPLAAYQTPSPDNLLVRAISDWVGHQLSSRGQLASRTHGKDLRELTRLTRLVERCIVLQPDEPAHYYRYGALLCLHGDGDGALAAFQEAGEQILDGAPRTAAADLLEVELALKNGKVPFEERDLHLARCAAHTARALHLGGNDAGRSVRDALAGQPQFEDLEDYQCSAGFAVTRHLVRQE